MTMAPANIGSSEQDGMQGMGGVPQAAPQQAAPAQAAPAGAPPATGTNEPDGMQGMTPTAPAPAQTDGEPDMSPNGGPQDAQITDALAAHIKSLQPEDQKFLAAHMTPEFVHAMGLINGPIVEQYLNQFADKDKVMVPVPRQVAEGLAQQQMEKMKQGQQPSAPSQGNAQPTQATPAPAAPAAPASPSGGMMAPGQ